MWTLRRAWPSACLGLPPFLPSAAVSTHELACLGVPGHPHPPTGDCCSLPSEEGKGSAACDLRPPAGFFPRTEAATKLPSEPSGKRDAGPAPPSGLLCCTDTPSDLGAQGATAFPAKQAPVVGKGQCDGQSRRKAPGCPRGLGAQLTQVPKATGTRRRGLRGWPSLLRTPSRSRAPGGQERAQDESWGARADLEGEEPPGLAARAWGCQAEAETKARRPRGGFL